MPREFISDWPQFSPSDEARRKAVVHAVRLMMNAALTAPLAGAPSQIEGEIVYGQDELEKIARMMEKLAYDPVHDKCWENMFKYEAVMVRESDAVLFLGHYRAAKSPFDIQCGMCGGNDCGHVYEMRYKKGQISSGLIDLTNRASETLINGPLCTMWVHNMGYGVGSALWMASRLMVDARPFMSVGVAGKELGYCQNSEFVVGIPVAASSKNPFMDIQPDYHVANMGRVVDTVRQTWITPRQWGLNYKQWDPAREFVYAPCQHACPLHVDVVGYVAFLAQGRFQEAIDLIRARIPLAGVCGRVCHHPCQDTCKRAEHDEAVAIMALKRFATDCEDVLPTTTNITVAESKNKRVAVVGAGPGGLTAAYYLRKMGYDVVVFEASPIAGGMLAVGIPEYRLPRSVLKKDINFIENLGVRFAMNTTLGKDISIEELFAQDYKAIFLATGAHRSKKLNIPGEELRGVEDGIAFLKQVNLGERPVLGGRVVIIGGGNVAIDVARSLRRIPDNGEQREITMLVLEERDRMVASEGEIQEALEEKITIINSVGPKRLIEKDGRVAGVETLKAMCIYDETGCFNPQYFENSEDIFYADTVIVAIGQLTDTDYLSNEINKNSDNFVKVDHVTLATSLHGVFAGGDLIRGTSTVIEAAADGERAARYIDKYLEGLPMVDEPYYPAPREIIPRSEEIPKGTRQVPAPQLTLGERLGSFKEIELGYNTDAAVKEAKRCIRCDLERGTSDLLFGRKR